MPLMRVLGWAVAGVGGMVGVLGLAYLGLQNISHAWIDRRWFSFMAASALFAIVPLLGSTLAVLNKRRLAAVTFLLVVPLFLRWALLYATDDIFLSRVCAAFAEVCFAFGLYWLFAAWKNWPPLFPRPLPSRRRILFCGLALSVISVSDLAITLLLIAAPQQTAIDCGSSAVFSRTTFGHEAVFTAHVIRTGHQVRVANTWLGRWGLARVQERFWGWHFPNIVFLVKNSGLRNGEEYLIDGDRPRGILTRFLPIVEIRICNRTALLADAGVELRLLRSGFPKSDVRVMGRVIRWTGKRPEEPYERQDYALVEGARVAISGPGGTITETTDREGIYDVGGLTPGRYKAELQGGTNRSMAFYDYWSDLKAGDVAEYSFSSE